MKVAVFGGGGVEGRSVSKILTGIAEISQVCILDRRQSKAEEVANQLGEKGAYEVADILDSESLKTAIASFDLVVNTAGPFYRLGTRVLEAAIAAGVDYIDICDDFEPTMRMLALHEPAKERGITAIVGIGSSPGFLNMVAKYGADKLDHVNNVDTYWSTYIPTSAGGVAAGLHGLHIFYGMVPQFLEGELVEVPAGSGMELVEFDEGIAPCYFCGHPEPVTLSRYIPGVKRVTNRGSLTPAWVTKEMLTAIDIGFGSPESIEVRRGVFVAPRDVALRVIGSNYLNRPPDPAVSGLKVVIEGERNNKYCRLEYRLGRRRDEKAEYSMDVVTAPPAAVAALMLLRGDVKTKGVYGPEGCLDPKTFLEELANMQPELLQRILETETTSSISVP